MSLLRPFFSVQRPACKTCHLRPLLQLASVLRARLDNVQIAKSAPNSELFSRLLASPEFFRFQLLSLELPALLAQLSAPAGEQ